MAADGGGRAQTDLQPSPLREPLSRREVWIMLAICAVAAAVRSYGLTARDLWLDEAYSLRFSMVPLDAFFRTIAHADQHPPLYYLILKAATAIGGQSEAALRIPSLVFSVLTVPAVYFLARRGGGPRAAAVAALLFALSAVHIRYAQEARMYALQVCGISWSLLGLLRALAASRFAGDDRTAAIPSESRCPSDEVRHGGRSRKAGRVEGWALYAAGAVLALYSQNTTLLYLACTSLAVLALVLAKRVTARSTLIGSGLALLVIAAAWSPWVPSFLAQARQVTVQFWIPPVDAPLVLRTFEALYAPLVGATALALRLGLLSLLVLVLVRGIGASRAPAWSWPLIAVLLLGPALLLLASLRTPLFIPRAVLWTTVPFFVFAGMAVAREQGRALRAGIIGILLAISAATVVLYHANFIKEQWRAAAVSAASMAGPGDIVLVHASAVSLPFRYYFDATASRAQVVVVPPFSLEGAWEPKFSAADEVPVRAIAEGGKRVLLVYSHFEYSDPQRRLAALLDSLYARREVRMFQGIELRRYWN